MADRTPAAKLPSHVVFPADWEHVATHRVGPFVTQVVHRLPDGALHVWSSRRHRKRRGGVIHRSGEGLTDETAQDVNLVHRHTKARQRRFHLWGWRPELLSWWIGVIFILGSICFVVGTVPPAFPRVLDRLGIAPFNYGLADFIGSVWFTIGSYLLLLEALNSDLDAALQLKAREAEGRLLDRAPLVERQKIRWFGWDSNRIDYFIALVQLTGAIIFNINCGMALVDAMGWMAEDVLVWTPSTIASCCFVTASYLSLLEVAHRPWAWLWWDVSWQSAFFSLLGSMGFLISSLVGYFAQGPIQLPQWFGDLFALMMGSWFFLVSTYLLVPEILLEDE